MMQLWIDGHEAVLKQGTTFKITRVNPYFEDQGDYTFDVQLPLAGCGANQRIFGPLHRPEAALVPMAGRKYDMRLLAPPLDISGYAIVTNATDEEVKVQMVAGRSSFQRAIEDDETYVDDLDLGNAWDGFPSFTDGRESWQPGYDTDEQAKIFYYKPTDNDGVVDVERMMHGTSADTDSVCFPVYGIDDDVVVNPHRVKTENLAGSAPYYFLSLAYSTGTEFYEPVTDATLVAPQPYLFDMLKRIIRAAGYGVGDFSEVENTWMRGIFIVNTCPVLRRAAALPHWTLPELLKEVQNFLGVVFTVSGDKRVSIRTRASWYGGRAAMQQLTLVTDELSTDIDADGENKGSSAGNVDYDWPNDDDILRLPDEVWENAVCESYSSLAAIEANVKNLKEQERRKSLWLFTDRSTGYVYALLRRKDTGDYELHRVDHFAPLIRNASKRDIDTTLKIVPARMTVQAPEGSGHLEPGEFNEGTIATGLPILAATGSTLTAANWYSVDAAINPDDDSEQNDADDGKDILEVAYFNGETYFNGDHNVPIPTAVTYITDPDTGLPELPKALVTLGGDLPADGPFPLRQGCAVGTALCGAASIDTRAEHLFRFLDDVPCDPTVPYLINGRRYACHKLELTIDGQGVQPLKQGYFYEIN